VLLPTLWSFPHLLLFPSVVFSYEFNQLKISRGFRVHKWIWFWKKNFSVRTKFIIVILSSINAMVIYTPIDITQKAYLNEDMLCVHPSIYFLAFGSFLIVLTLCYFSYRIYYVDEPFFLKYEVLLNFFAFMPLIIWFMVYLFYPAPFLPFFDLRISSLVAAIGGFTINMLFPTLLTFDSFERKMNRKKISKDESQELLAIKLRRTSSDQFKDEFYFVLQSPILFDSFVEYTVKNWSVENVLFYQAVEKFEEEFNNPGFNSKEEVQKIVEEFITQGSPLEVNIESRRRQEIFNALKSGNIVIDIFSGAKYEIYCLMKGDSFEKWRSTPAYIAALKEEVERSQSFDSSSKRNSLHQNGVGIMDDFLTGSGRQKLPKTARPITVSPNSSSDQNV